MEVWSWIVSNKQWVFDGFGVVVIIGVGKYLYSRFKRSKNPVEKSPNVQHGKTGTGHVININGHVAGPVTVGDATSGFSSIPAVPVSTIAPLPVALTAKQILDDISSTPPFQREEKAKYYEGLSVDWDCEFRSIRKLKDGMVDVTLGFGKLELSACDCKVRLSDYPQLKVMHSGQPVRITGTVAGFNMFIISLDNAKLSFSPKLG